MKRLACTLVLVAATTATSSLQTPTPPDRFALVGGTVYPVSSSPIPNGVIVVNGETIEAVGANVAVPAGYQRIDVKGQSVFPGLVNAHTSIGLTENTGAPNGSDINEVVDPVLPQLNVTDAFRLDSRNAPVVRRYGVTSVLVAPGDSNVIAGQSAVVSLSGGRLDRVLIKPRAAMHFTLGDPPKRAYGSRNRAPMTRMGIVSLIRQALIDARQYGAKKKAGAITTTDARLEALQPVVDGTMPAIFRAQRMDDIQVALRIAEEFSLKLVISHGVDAYKVAPELARRQVPVLLGPVLTQPDQVETLGAIYENAAILAAAGVRFAVMTTGATQAGQLPFHAGITAAYGVDPTVALESITLTPATILGVANRIGSLDKGKQADIVVADGLILQPRAKVTRVFIKGKEASLRTWQEELYDEYR